MKKLSVLFVGAEALPFIKVGGLGDVLGSLPKTLVKHGIDARLVIPCYATMKYDVGKLKEEGCFNVNLAWRNLGFRLFSTVVDGVKVYLINNEQYFGRGKIYGEYDDVERFAFFSRAVLEMLNHIDFKPDIINSNDWHTAMVPVYYDLEYRYKEGYENIKHVFSIHNIEFQGKLDPYVLGSLLGIDEFNKEKLMYDGCLNLMKGAIECSDKVVTVSETYANEIMNEFFSHGLHYILRENSYKLKGIVNGIDVDLFNPLTDKHLPYNYSIENYDTKKQIKKKLQEKLGLEVNENIPVLGMVGRITSQKGFDIVFPVLNNILDMGIQIVILGTGDPAMEHMLMECQNRSNNRMKALIMFSQELASNIYAGSDMFLMPSKAEPCGLSQMIAMRYGSIPVVNSVGGLKDTVIPYNETDGTGNGVNFQSYNCYDMLDAVRRANEILKDDRKRQEIITNAMKSDFSWDNSVKKYIELFNEIKGV